MRFRHGEVRADLSRQAVGDKDLRDARAVVMKTAEHRRLQERVTNVCLRTPAASRYVVLETPIAGCTAAQGLRQAQR